MICFTSTSKLTSSLASLIKASTGVSQKVLRSLRISQYSGYTFGLPFDNTLMTRYLSLIFIKPWTISLFQILSYDFPPYG